MAAPLNKDIILRALGWAYDAALVGWTGVDNAEQLAQDYNTRPGSARERADALIRMQIVKTAATGFLTGLGGLITLPLAVPGDLASAYFMQLRMIAAIAIMGGYDTRSDQVRTLSYLCMCGAAAGEIAKEIGIELGEKLTERAFARITAEVATSVNEKVGFRLLATLGEKGGISFGRAIPFFGGLISAGFNGVVTNEIGDAARDLFLPRESAR